MTRYRFTGLTDEFRLIDTVVGQSQMEYGEASFIVKHNLERCVEVWEGDMLCGYFMARHIDSIINNGSLGYFFREV